MKHPVRSLFGFSLLGLMLGGWFAFPVQAQDTQCCGCEPDGQQNSGAIYRICMPTDEEWNGSLIVYAHGFVDPSEPVAIPEDQLVAGDLLLPEIVTGVGYAFATTSYSINGLAVKEGLADVMDLVDVFSTAKGSPQHVYIIGASEGGLIATLALEQHPDIFHGGAVASAPIGDFNYQIRVVGDFRNVFDYFFPSLLPASPVSIPLDLIADWDNFYDTNVASQVFRSSNRSKLNQLLAVTKVPVNPLNATQSKKDAVKLLLTYNVTATNDATAKLGGQPYNNAFRLYQGSKEDVALNRNILRYGGSPAATDEIEANYQTTGALDVPLVILHSRRDPLVPFQHTIFYMAKVLGQTENTTPVLIPSNQFGHASFTDSQVLAAFALMVYRVEGRDQALRVLLDSYLSSIFTKAEFQKLARRYNLPTK